MTIILFTPGTLLMTLLWFLVFYKSENKFGFVTSRTTQMKLLTVALLILVGVVYRCSISLTNGTVTSHFPYIQIRCRCTILPLKTLRSTKLMIDCMKYFVNIEGLSGGEIIDINQWSIRELNVPFYPET